MTRSKGSEVPSGGEGDNRPKQSRRRRRAPRVKPMPDAMRDPRHDPEAARAEFKKLLAGDTGRPLTVGEGWAWLARIDEDRHHEEKLELDKEGHPRFREQGERYGPGRLKLPSELVVEQAEADFARTVNELDRLSNLRDHQGTAVRRAASVRSGKGADVAAKVCQLYDESPLPVRNRASAITRSMARKGYPISVQQVRKILRTHRSGKLQK